MLAVVRKVLVRESTPLGCISLGAGASPSGRLLSTLAVLEQRDGHLKNKSLSAFTAAKKLGGSVHGFIAGSKVQDAAEEAAKVDGVEQVIAVDNPVYEKVLHPPFFTPCVGFAPPFKSFACRGDVDA